MWTTVTRRISISGETPLQACPEQRIGMALPAPLSDRLDALVSLAERSGERTNRKELLASLVLDAKPVGEELGRLLRQYRQASAREAMIGEARQGPLRVTPRRPGPRPRRRQA